MSFGAADGLNNPNTLLTSATKALTEGNTATALYLFAEALVKAPTVDTQYYVAYHLHSAGLHADLINVLRPYFQASTATPELAVTVLDAAVKSGDVNLAHWMLDHMPDSTNPLVAQGVAAATHLLAAQSAAQANGPAPGLPLPSSLEDSGRNFSGSKKTVLVILGVVVAVVAAVAVLVSSKPTEAKSTAKNQAYCSDLLNMVRLTTSNNNAVAAQTSQVKATEQHLLAVAPAGVKVATQKFVTLSNKIALAKNSPNPPTAPDTPAFQQFLPVEATVFAWGRANCASNWYAQVQTVLSSADQTPSSKVPGPPSTTTTEPPTSLTVTGGTQTVVLPSGKIQIAVTTAVSNPPLSSRANSALGPYTALYITVTNLSATKQTLGQIDIEVTANGTGTVNTVGPLVGTYGTTTLGPAFSWTNAIPAHGSISGWQVITAPGQGQLTFTFHDGTAIVPAGHWTLSP